MVSPQPKSWSQYMDQLDAALDRVEAVLDSPLDSGVSEGSRGALVVPPTVQLLLDDDSLGIGSTAHLGQMSGGDEPRALALLERQSGVIARARAVQGDIRAHLRVVEGSSRRAVEAPAFLDVQS